ncbi:IS66 family insertion sequence element accessory protein TnpA [Dysgonomonas termitidis]
METNDYVRGVALSEAEGFALIESFYTSRRGAEAWYRGLGMSKHTFYKWKHRYDAIHAEGAPSEPAAEPEPCRLVPVRIVDAPSGEVVRGIEVRYPNGVVLALPAEPGIGIGQLAELLKLKV